MATPPTTLDAPASQPEPPVSPVSEAVPIPVPVEEPGSRPVLPLPDTVIKGQINWTYAIAIVGVHILALAGVGIDRLEKEAIRQTLAMTGGNREQAAEMLGIGERTLYRKLKEYGLK